MKTVFNPENIDTRHQPLFLGQDLSLQRYDRIKYPKLLELAEAQEEFFWRPKEVSLLKDRSDYITLSEAEKFVFDTNLKWQTMTDSMLSRSIFNITQYVTNPELEACMNVWAFFESNIHSRSYSYILKNVYVNESKFWNSILEDQEIVNRSNDIKNSYDRLFGSPKDIKQEIFDAILSTQITEGLSFYTSFVCSFFFGARGKMEGTAKIVKLIARDENLHVAITQNILGYFRDHKEEGFQEIVAKNEEKVYETYRLAVKNEQKWIEYLFSKGNLLGLNEEILKNYIEWLANNRLASLGYKKLYDAKKNPLGTWYDQYGNSQSMQPAPQETEITNYRIGARDTQTNFSEFSGVEL
jgi:ribonucleoside-diphosphate reductase beta chain